MPQKRNPDVFELIRGRSATAQACLLEVMGIVAKLPSGYQRDLQLIKAPLFRSIDLCLDTLAILPAALAGVSSARTGSGSTPPSTPPPKANELVVKEGISFREAYRRVGEKLKKVRCQIHVRIWFRPRTRSDVSIMLSGPRSISIACACMHLGIEFTELGADYLRGAHAGR